MKKDNQPDAGPALEVSTTKASQGEPAEDNEQLPVSKG